MKEPSVLDYVKSKLMPWKKSKVIFAKEALEPLLSEAEAPVSKTSEAAEETETAKAAIQPLLRERIRWPWSSLAAVFFALLAQFLLEPKPNRDFWPSIFLYALSAGWLVWALKKGEWRLSDCPDDQIAKDPYTIRQRSFLAALIAMPLAFLALSGNRFNIFNLLLWGFTIAACLHAFWLGSPQFSQWISWLRLFLAKPELNIRLSREMLIGGTAVALILFFRLHLLNQVPLEMTSDHAEKLLDVWDVLHGTTPIFFIRNTGREPLQFYLTALVAQVFGTGISFLSLKIGTTLAGLVTLVYLYRLGKELGNKEVGLFAVLMAGIAYWPNLITRIGLRFTFYPMATAICLYYLLRGLRRSSRNDLILAGLSLGMGLHTYSPARALVLVFLAGLGVYFLHQKSRAVRLQTLLWMCIITIVTFVVFLPLVRFATQFPEQFFYRTLTRIGTVEQPFPGPPLQIFLSNLWKASVMYFWDNGEIWTVSIPHRPALDIFSASLFFIGLLLVGIRYLRRRNWIDLFLLIAIPLLMLPSILALAFPSENPALNRTSGALVIVFLIIGVAQQSFLSTLRQHLSGKTGQKAAWIAGLGFLLLAGMQNYQLVFDEHRQIYDYSSWNTSEVGKVIRGFADSVGSLDTAWVIPYPYWLDTRLVGMKAGIPTRDYALFIDQIETTLDERRAKLFICKFEDQQALDRLISLYPEGRLRLYNSRVPTKEFWIFTVLPKENPILPQTP